MTPAPWPPAATFNYILAAVATAYVSTNGANTVPYTNWTLAARSIQNALALSGDGSLVLVTNGQYGLSSTLNIENGTALRSVNGAASTIINGSNAVRCVLISHADASLAGFTVTNGSAGDNNGGGVYLGAGIVSNCVVIKNTANGAMSGGGGGIYAASGTVQNVIIEYNYSGLGAGGAMVLPGAVLRSCLVAANECTGGGNNNGGGGVLLRNGGAAINCTIVRNRDAEPGADSCGGLFLHVPGGYTGINIVTNTIIYSNIKSNGTTLDWFLSGATTNGAGYNCTIPQLGGTGTNADPGFVANGSGAGTNAVLGDYHLASALSPCVDKGANLAWMTGATDLDGADRLYPGGGTVDIGAYEYHAGALNCSYSVTPARRIAPFDAVFTATLDGAGTNGAICRWDFDGNGTFDLEGAGLLVVTNPYSAIGVYTPVLQVTNSIGAVAVYSNATVTAAPAAMYVATNGGNVFPYTNWSNAARTINATVDLSADGTLVMVTNGNYVLSSPVALSVGAVVRSVNGADVTFINGSNAMRCVSVTASNALLCGFTITNGSAGANNGGGIFMTAGTVSNCTVVRNTSLGGTYGGGGGLYMEGGTLANSLILRNFSAAGGGIFAQNSSRIRNCLIAANGCSGGAGHTGGGGVWAVDGVTVESCTIVRNYDAENASGDQCGGLYLSGTSGTITNYVTNSIVYFNSTAGTTNRDWYPKQGVYQAGYNCAAPSLGSSGTTNDPLFMASGSGFGTNAVLGDYRLSSSASPCADKGTNLAWMQGAVDLVSGPRIVNGRVDIGAYEMPPAGSVFKFR